MIVIPAESHHGWVGLLLSVQDRYMACVGAYYKGIDAEMDEIIKVDWVFGFILLISARSCVVRDRYYCVWRVVRRKDRIVPSLGPDGMFGLSSWIKPHDR